MLGDVLPDSLRTYYSALDMAQMDEALGAFATDVMYALPPAGQIETSPRVVRSGRVAVRAWLAERGARDWHHEIQLSVRDGDNCLVEGVTRRSGGPPVATFVASVQLDGAGLIRRYLAYQCAPPAEPAPSGSGPAPGHAMHVLHEYFDALDRGDFEAAADCFSDDVVYNHPPYRHTGIDSDERVVFRGRQRLRAAFEARGKQSFDHAILVAVQRGPHCLFEGVVQGLANGGTGSFISSLTLDAAGRIQRYVSFFCEPGVSRS